MVGQEANCMHGEVGAPGGCGLKGLDDATLFLVSSGHDLWFFGVLSSLAASAPLFCFLGFSTPVF